MKNKPNKSTLHHHNNGSIFPLPDHDAEILAEQIKLLYQQNKSALLATLLLAIIVVLVLWNHVPKNWLLGWLAATYLITFVRYLLIRSYFRRNPSIAESASWGHLFLLGVFFSGLLWSAAGAFFFVDDSVVHQLFIAYLLGGMIAGAMSTLSSYKNAFLIFSAPIAFTFAYQAISHGDSTYTAIAVTYLMFLFMMTSISQRLHRTIIDSLRLRFDNFDLVNNLLQAKKALQNANDQLEQRVADRTEALARSNTVLQQEKELFRITLASIGDAVITTDCLGKLTYLNPTAELFTGWHNSEAKGAPLDDIFHIVDVVSQEPINNSVDNTLNKQEEHAKNRECLLIRKDEQQYVINYSVAPIHNEKENVIGAVLTFRDVTEQRKLTQKLEYQAAHDPLTGLLNRDEFETRLTKVLASLQEGQAHALLYLDLDQFKVVNDTCGHSAGDELLRQVTALLNSKLRTRDTLARLGGDEFGIILEHCPQKEAIRIAHTLREIVQDFRYQWQNKIFTIGASIGLFPINQCNESLSKAMSAADSACYAAKESGRNRVHVYQADDSLPQKRSGEMQWLPRIQLAMAEKRLCLYFQPILPISNIKGLEEHGEILLRLRDEQGQLILPGAFLPSAERYDQMLMIDRWVVKQSLKLLRTANHQQAKVTYAINLSAQALGDENFLDFVVDTIKTYKQDPSGLCFEITENVALADLKHVANFISSLKELGCRFSMDDFGSGLSSFSYLKDIPLDYLKIDGRLVKDMITDPVDHAMVEAIHNIGHVMELKTIAEWVENAKTMRLLEKMGVDYVQGFWLAKPHLIDRADEDK